MLSQEEQERRSRLMASLGGVVGIAQVHELEQLIELERKDAARMCPVCEIEHNTERMLADSTLPIVDLKNFEDEPTKEQIPNLRTCGVEPEIWVTAQGSAGKWTAECSRCHTQRPVCCAPGAGLVPGTETPEYRNPVCAECCGPH